MGLSCGARALKFCLFLFNLAFVICGLVCVILGVWLILDRYAVDNLALAISHVKQGFQQNYQQDDGLVELASKPTAVRQIGYLLLFGGIAVIVVASLGCCGAAKEWRPLLCCYASCLMLILAIEIAAGIYAAMHSHMFDKDFRQILRASLKLYNGTDTPSTILSNEMLVKTAWDKLMQEKACCGVDSRLGEFSQSGWYQLTKGRSEFPPACCPPKRNGKLVASCPTVFRYGEGCYNRIKESIQELTMQFKVVMWTAIVISLIQIFGVIVAFCLCNAISEAESSY
ncbi:Tetraspanin [Meloidogyne graminicola]|uniref:Tetraspanin n=1 Tax=Meloidogyne graminicola TaxID=189291 RepID=A0A8S9ZIE9_9BILA|nr:Tetraspanin [Meloidogyne graminicola]